MSKWTVELVSQDRMMCANEMYREQVVSCIVSLKVSTSAFSHFF